MVRASMMMRRLQVLAWNTRCEYIWTLSSIYPGKKLCILQTASWSKVRSALSCALHSPITEHWTRQKQVYMWKVDQGPRIQNSKSYGRMFVHGRMAAWQGKEQGTGNVDRTGDDVEEARGKRWVWGDVGGKCDAGPASDRAGKSRDAANKNAF